MPKYIITLALRRFCLPGFVIRAAYFDHRSPYTQLRLTVQVTRDDTTHCLKILFGRIGQIVVTYRKDLAPTFGFIQNQRCSSSGQQFGCQKRTNSNILYGSMD